MDDNRDNNQQEKKKRKSDKRKSKNDRFAKLAQDKLSHRKGTRVGSTTEEIARKSLPLDWSIEKRKAVHPQRGEYERLQYRDPLSGRVMHSLPEALDIAGSAYPPSDQPGDDSDAIGPFSSPIHESDHVSTAEIAGPSQAGEAQTRPSTYFFVGLGSQVDALVDSINQSRKCRTPWCKGDLVQRKVVTKGKGCAVEVLYECDGCPMKRNCDETVTFNSSVDVFQSRRLVTNLALMVAFIASGFMYADIHKVLALGLGIPVITETNFYNVIKHLYGPVGELLGEQLEEAKQDMRDMNQEEIGSWSRAVTCSDGVWQTRGHYSKNATYTVRDYNRNCLLYIVHKCQRGFDSTAEEKLFEGTSKSAEGHSTEEAFTHAKEEGMKVEVHWQDADSSSANAIQAIMPEAKVMKCLGHVGRAHNHQLDALMKKKSFTTAYINMNKQKFPDVKTVKCVCANKNHNYKATANKPACGCMDEIFRRKARINHWCAANQCEKDPQRYATTLRLLGRYHARDVHQWEGGECGFHPQLKCSCKNCKETEELQCQGKPYTTNSPLTCPLHALAYEIEVEKRAEDADNVIHREMGRGHSNLNEASHNVLIRYRSKDVSLNRLHYIVSTNIGLLQGNMSWALDKYGMQYHWIIRLYEKLNLPIFDGMLHEIQKSNEERVADLQRKKSEGYKNRRMQLKTARVQEQEVRKLWGKRQKDVHTYGVEGDDEDDDVDSEDEQQAGISKPQQAGVGVNDGSVDIIINVGSRKQCRCGATTHQRTSSKECPFNKNNLPDISE